MSFETAGMTELEKDAVKPTPRGEWAKASVDAEFHLDPDKQDPVDPDSIANKAELRAILDQIARADLEVLDGVFDRLSEAVISNPDIVKDPTYLQKLEAAHKRMGEIMGTTPDGAVLH